MCIFEGKKTLEIKFYKKKYEIKKYLQKKKEKKYKIPKKLTTKFIRLQFCLKERKKKIQRQQQVTKCDKLNCFTKTKLHTINIFIPLSPVASLDFGELFIHSIIRCFFFIFFLKISFR